MGKRFKAKVCAYCGSPGGTADHVFARTFFPVEDRSDLPQVSACEACNREKAQLEHYLSSILPFGARHPGASQLFAIEVPRRLAKNRKLHLELAQGRQDILVDEQGAIRPSITVPIDAAKLAKLFAYIARGLAMHSWHAAIPNTYVAGAGFLTSEGERSYETLMKRRARAEVRGNLGSGLVLYQGVQGELDPHFTLWRFQLYGGMTFAGDANAPGDGVSNIWACTASHAMPGFGSDVDA